MKEIQHSRHGKIWVTDHVYNLIEKNKREQCPQRTPEWYTKRMNHITASAMASICKANPYESRLSVFKKKLGEGPVFKGNKATEWGNLYEDVAIEKYEKLKNERVLEFGLLESLNPNEEFLAGSPDGITATEKLIEVKCPYRRVPTEVVPIHYVYQVQFLMHILRLKTCDFIQFVPESTWNQEVLIITKVDYDPNFFKVNWYYLKSFWDSVMEARCKRDNESSFNLESDMNLEAIEDVQVDNKGNVIDVITIPKSVTNRKRKSVSPPGRKGNKKISSSEIPECLI